MHLGFINDYVSSPERSNFYEQFDYGNRDND